ncbi:shikimate 5-dehydrogenase [Microcystis aeruginosa NIES-3804]|uniref:Shikimate 5-dehydrogenase n=2 Tax=Microcystis aeruginosa TaxID=1126 RepID=A0A6H9GWS8_MICAE|nr:shikimate dehydrogenase [Microcystis aeruginosa]GCL50512.1 shikimate 5-dehydrogenase [Microcystis aeruginosa NIES-3804]
MINAIVVIPSLPKDRRITNNDYQPTILLGDRIFPEIQMSQSPVTDSLEIILTNITEKLDSLQKDFTDLKVDMAEVKTELKIIDRRLEKVEGTQDALIQDVSDLKGAKSLIIPVVVAVLTSILTLLVRSIPNP